MTLISFFLDAPATGGYTLELKRRTPGSSGYDLQANIGDARIIEPMRRFTIATGLYLAMPLGVEAQVRPRSGLVRDHGVMAAFGSIDSDYRGEIKVTMINLGHEPYKVLPGDRIAQLVFAPVMLPGQSHVPPWTRGSVSYDVHPGMLQVADKESLGDTTRGASGFGSTGRSSTSFASTQLVARCYGSSASCSVRAQCSGRSSSSRSGAAHDPRRCHHGLSSVDDSRTSVDALVPHGQRHERRGAARVRCKVARGHSFARRRVRRTTTSRLRVACSRSSTELSRSQRASSSHATSTGCADEGCSSDA